MFLLYLLCCVYVVDFCPQIHILESGEVRIFSRNQEDNTSKYPDIISRIPKVKDSRTRSAAAQPLGERGVSLSCDFQMRAFTAVRIASAHIYLTHSVFRFASLAHSLTHLSGLDVHTPPVCLSLKPLCKGYLFFCLSLPYLVILFPVRATTG